MKDITFETEEGFFGHRVGAIIICEGKLLAIKNAKHPYYYTIGGRVKMGELSEEAVIREAYEETNIKFTVERLCFVHENIFIADFLKDRQPAPFHEVGLYYLLKSDNLEGLCCNSLGMDRGEESLHWLPVNELSGYDLYPKFFEGELPRLNEEEPGVKHFITKNGLTFKGK